MSAGLCEKVHPMPIRVPIRRVFPNAQPLPDAFARMLDELAYGHNIDLDHVLMGTSLCVDEANAHSLHELSYVHGDVPDFTQDTFDLGGLAGFPFTGIMGITAFAQHVPDGGTALLVYGPHIGISDDGAFGVIQRWGQANLSNACGSLLAAVQALETGDVEPVLDPDNYQQAMVQRNLMPYRAEILGATSPLLAATEITYRLIEQQLCSLLASTAQAFTCRHVALWGNIFINTGSAFATFVEQRHFEIIAIDDLPGAARPDAT